MKQLSLEISGPHAGQSVRSVGAEWGQASAALILVHGRGACAADILPLMDNFNVSGFIYLAPEALGHLWYPNRYDSPLEKNEPFLSSWAAATPISISPRDGSNTALTPSPAWVRS